MARRHYMLNEIKETPITIKNFFADNFNRVRVIANKIHEFNPLFSMFIGRGSSDNACIYGQYLFEYMLRIPSFLSTGSIYLLYKRPPIYNKGLVIGISQSGETDDVLRIADYSMQLKNLVIGITNVEKSSLHQTTKENTILLNAGEERSVCATKSFTASLLAILLLAASIRGTEISLNDVLNPIEYVLSKEYEIRNLAEIYTFASDAVILGTGFSYSIALETSLKLKEACYIKSIGSSTIDFLHGPLAILSKNTPVVVFAPNDETASLSEELIKKIKKTQSYLLIVSDNKNLGKLGDLYFELPQTKNILYPFAEVLFAQLFSYYLSIAKGLNPDKPRYLKKITRI